MADAWLTAQEPILQSRELGSSVDEVEQLIRRHEAFRKAAAAWEERFSSLRRLTTVSTPDHAPATPTPIPLCVTRHRVEAETDPYWAPSPVGEGGTPLSPVTAQGWDGGNTGGCGSPEAFVLVWGALI